MKFWYKKILGQSTGVDLLQKEQGGLLINKNKLLLTKMQDIGSIIGAIF